MDFNSDIILQNDVVKIQPLKTSDFNLLSEFSLKEPGLWEYSLVPASGLDNLKKYIDLAMKARESKTSYPFIIIDRRTNEVAGSTRFYDIQEGHNTTQIGYTWYGKKFQGTGLNKNCKLLLLEYAFEKIGFERVEFRADNNNIRSITAMKSIGCTVEGVLRSNCKSLDGRRDSIVLSILKNEWLNGLKSKLQLKIKQKSNEI